MIIPVSYWWKPTAGAACAWDPNNQTSPTVSPMTLTNANRTARSNATSGIATPQVILCTVGHSTGKWYYELIDEAMTVGVSTGPAFGIANTVADVGLFSTGIYVTTSEDQLWVNGGVPFTGGVPWMVGEHAGVAVDLDAHKCWLAHNNVWYLGGDPATGANSLGAWSGLSFPAQRVAGGQGVQKGTLCPTTPTFLYTPPTGFAPWCSGS